MKHLYLPDVQLRPGDDPSFLETIGNFIVAKKPDVIVCAGDFADMPSLSSYDVGKKSFEGQRYTKDIYASHIGMELLLGPLAEYNQRAYANKQKKYKPRMVLTLGNHEHRITRAVENDAKLEGLISVDDLHYEGFGWEVVPFLEVVVIDGVAYSHYFTTGVMGRPSTSAQSQLNRQHMSCIAGHQQGLQIATSYNGAGKRITSVIAGSCYEHDEHYMGAQGNNHWRGCLMLHDVQDGEFNLVPVPLKYIKENYA